MGVLIDPYRSADTDPYWANVVLLMHCDGTNGSTSFVDETGKTFSTIGGTAQMSTAQQKFGTASMSLDGNADYVVVDSSYNTAFQFGSGDFTVEAFIRTDVIPGGGNYDGIVAVRITGSNQFSWGLYLNGDNSGAVRFDYSTTGTSTTGSALAGVPSTSTWQHVAAVRNGSSLVVYLDGVGGTSHNIASATLHAASVSAAVGVLGTGTPAQAFDGFLDEIRITKGVARYTSNFTPPTRAFPGAP